MISQSVLVSDSLEQAVGAFLDEIGEWVRACIADYADGDAGGETPLPVDVHDQGSYTAAWGPYLKARGDERGLRWMARLRDRVNEHFHATDQWRHGYWRMQEAHHGTEHFEIFLGQLWDLRPDDAETVARMVDAVEHVGNWSPDVPPWFDWDTGLFRSFHFGADGVGEAPGDAVNVPDHLRCVNLCLIADDMTGEPRYLNLARTHGHRWAEAIVHCDRLPVGLRPEGGVCAATDDESATYHSAVTEAPGHEMDIDRAENFLASAAVDALLSLWVRTAEGVFRRAAERLLDLLATQLVDPDATAVAAALRTYRDATGDGRYDAAVFDAAARIENAGPSVLAVDPEVRHARADLHGIGKRADMPAWFEDGRPRRCNPALMALTAELSDDRDLARGAIDLARAQLALARRVFPHGRDHGCGSRSVASVARGHGRDNGAGVVTAVLAPVMRAFDTPGASGHGATA